MDRELHGTGIDEGVLNVFVPNKGGRKMIEVTEMEMHNESKQEKVDVVNQPQHYRQGTFEVIDEMIMAFGPQRTYDFCILNAWKYRSRAPYKGTPEQDMEKADRYMQMAYQIAKSNGMIGGCCNGYPIGNLIKGVEDGRTDR